MLKGGHGEWLVNRYPIILVALGGISIIVFSILEILYGGLVKVGVPVVQFCVA